MSAPPDRISELLHSMQSCISDVKAWATANMLKLNDNKTELMLVTSKRTKHLHSLPTSITIGNVQITFKESVKNLGFTLDCHLTMNAHISNIARTCYFEMRRLASIRRFLTSTATLVSAFALSRIDYCNSLLFGSTHDVTSHLQRIQNYAARVILRLPKSSSITIHLKSLHWLPVKVRSTYKIACLCYHCHSSTAPSYVTGMLHRKPLHTRNTRSSSYTMPLLNRPAHSKATLGDRSFSFASSSVWNSIPNDLRCAPSLSSFKSRLKIYLFCSFYKGLSFSLIIAHLAWFGLVIALLMAFLKNALMCIKKVKLINHDCLPILMLYIMLYIMHAYLMLFAALSNAVCLYSAFSCH